MKKTLLLAFLFLVAVMSNQAQAASTSVGINVSRGQGDSMAYTLNVAQMYESWISNGVCELAPLAEVGAHVWDPDDNDEDAIWGGYLGVGLRFSLLTNNVIRPYIEGGVGGALNSERRIDGRNLGSHALFRTRGAVGVNFGEAYNHKVQGDVIHFSTYGLTHSDDGYTTYGLSYGYSF